MTLFDQLFGKPAPAIDASELQDKLKNGKRPFVIDVRQPGEYRTGHIAGAKLIPLAELSHRMKEIPQDKEIVCVCASGSRSSSATRALARAGFNVVNLKGGMLSWNHQSLPVKKGDSA